MPVADEPGYSLITDPAAVIAALCDLQVRGDGLMLRVLGTGTAHPMRLCALDEPRARLCWQSTSRHRPVVRAGDRVQFEAHGRAGHLVSSALRCTVAPDGTLYTRLPLRLTLRHARRDWRARPLPGEMIVHATITRPGDIPLRARLVDLSVGGCRLALPGDAAPESGEHVNLCLCFPNGERALFGARVVEVACSADRGRQAGLTFAGVSDAQTRQLWFFTCEIDREAERRRRDRGELRALAASPLFQPPS